MKKAISKSVGLFVGTIFIFILSISFLGLIQTLFKSLIDIFLLTISKESILMTFTEINYVELIGNAFGVGVILFFTFVLVAITLIVLDLFSLLPDKFIEKYINYIFKFLLALYPTIFLAMTFDERLFSIITNIISFFAIFTFIFNKNET